MNGVLNISGIKSNSEKTQTVHRNENFKKTVISVLTEMTNILFMKQEQYITKNTFRKTQILEIKNSYICKI